ncbi:MAG TPA: transcriptional regulator, partial [Firmicutes bacterium]|nr:transcriptional regulator [Bacillota bacterium]
DSRSRKIFETIGVYLGYSLAYYAMLYKAKRVLIFGNVTSGEGGAIILAMTDKVLATEFPDIHRRLDLHLPGESGRRLGQAVVVASLPELHA